jgi:Tol biopolymer transport system component
MNARPSPWWHLTLSIVIACLSFPTHAGSLKLVSAADPSLGPPAGASGDSWAPVISADGRYVLFASLANNLVSNSAAGPLPVLFPPRLNVFLRDRTNETTTLVSVNLSGNGGNGDSMPRAISTNGQYALFESAASDLVPGDNNNAGDVFIRDLVAGATRLVSVATNGGPGNGLSQESVMTPDGRYVAFSSAANNLVPGDTNGLPDIFVRDMQAGTTTLASVGAFSAYWTSGSESPDLTPDGRYVAFFSLATNLVAGDAAPPGVNIGRIYVRDLVAGATFWASTNALALLHSATGATNSASYNHAISADGQFVAFESFPSGFASPFSAGVVLRYNLQSGLTDLVNTNAAGIVYDYPSVRGLDLTPDGRFIAFIANATGVSASNTAVYVWDAQSGTTTLASADTNNLVPSNSICASPVIDSSGQSVVFLCNANLTPDSAPPGFHLYRRDLQAGVTRLVDAPIASPGSTASPATVPSLSADGRFVAFEYPDGNLVPNDNNRDYDIFVRDLAADVTELISVHHPALTSVAGNGPSLLSVSCISTNGRYVAFSSEADNLVPNDTNGYRDVFVRDLLSGTNILASVAADGSGANGISTEPVLSADGRFVAFTSTATNLVSGATNDTGDVYVRDLVAGTNALVSVSTNGVSPGNHISNLPMISADGRYVLFHSQAGNLAAGFPAIEIDDVFLRDMQAATTRAVTTNGLNLLYAASMTPDGHFVAVGSIRASGSGGTLFVWDSQSITTVFTTNFTNNIGYISISPDGKRIAYGNGSTPLPSVISALDLAVPTNRVIASTSLSNPQTTRPGLRFSADGRYLAYATSASLVPSDSNNAVDIYLYDFQTGTNILVSRRFMSPGAGNARSDFPDLSADGRLVAYFSQASNLVPGDNNAVPDLFLYDNSSGATTLLTASQLGNFSANNHSINTFFSGDGQTLVFNSWASDIAPLSFNNTGNLYAFQPYVTGTTNPPPPFPETISLTTTNGQSLPAGLGGPGPTLTWPVSPGRTYQAQFKDNLDDPVWQNINGDVTLVGGQGYATDFAPSASQRFYRIVSF